MPLVADRITQLRQATKRLRRATLAGGITVLASAATLLMTAPDAATRVVLAAVIAGYLALKVRAFLRQQQAIRQLRLEERFVRHGPLAAHLASCLRQSHHLWMQSTLWQGLRHILADAPQLAPHVPQRRTQMARAYQRALRPLPPRRGFADLGLLLVILATWLSGGATSLFPTAPLFVLLGTLPLWLAVTAEVVRLVTAAELRAAYSALADALADWTQHQHFVEALQQQQRYRHTVLYQTWLPSAASSLASDA